MSEKTDTDSEAFTTAYHCQNCGAHVTETYARVRSLPGERNPRACPWCPDKTYSGAGGDGVVREAKSQRRGG